MSTKEKPLVLIFPSPASKIFNKMREEKFEVKVEGLAIKGWLVVPKDYEKKRFCVFVLHGIPRSKPSPDDPGYMPFVRELASNGFLSVFFNFRGTGESGGNFHILGWARDLKAVLSWLAQKYAPEKIALVGFSGGASVAIYHSAHNPDIDAVISVSSPAHFSALGVDKVPELLIKNFRQIGLIRDDTFPSSVSRWLEEFEEISPIKWVDKISPRPILFIHGEKDELVPLEHAQMLYEKAGEPKEFFCIKNGQHRLRVDRRALDKIKSWLINWKESNE